MINFDKITAQLLEKTKKVASQGADRFNLIDGVFALGDVAKTTGDLIDNIKESFSTRLPDGLPSDLNGLPITDLFRSFLNENREKLEVIGTAAPGIIEMLLAQLMGDEGEFDLPLDDAKEWFEGILDNVIDQALGMIGNKDFDLFEFLKNFESIADVFIQEWLLSQFDRDLGV